MKSADPILEGISSRRFALPCYERWSLEHCCSAALKAILQSTSFNGLDYGPQKHLLDLKRDLREIKKKLSIFHLSEH